MSTPAYASTADRDRAKHSDVPDQVFGATFYPLIAAYCPRRLIQMSLIPMTNTHHATMEELVVGKDLSWMDRFPAVHEPEAEYLTRNRKNKRPHKKENRQRRRP